MEKLQVSKILVKNAKLVAVKLSGASVNKLIKDTKQKQADVLKLREIDQEMLKVVVQL